MSRFFAALLGLGLLAAPAAGAETRTAIFAGGCFWCVESDFDKLAGVTDTLSGYTGGDLENPTYRKVGSGGTGHLEAVQITYDPEKVDYDTLLTVFWHSVDPTDPGGQFCDRGETYQTAIFVMNDEERALAEASKAAAEAELGQKIVTPVREAKTFWPAEDYHQNYYEKNPIRYRFYRGGCKRDRRIEELWGEAAFKGLPKK
ncbi:MAG: peptide-methionine (S)-S-oxide reductase MsrA [Alphaproteobacteria bacterium]